jgi:hypothetical protein
MVKGGTINAQGGVQEPLREQYDMFIVALIIGVTALLLSTWDVWVVGCFYLSRGARDSWTGTVLWIFFNR